MKTKRGWYILLVMWVILLAAQTLSYLGVLPLGEVSGWYLPACAVGILVCILNIRNKN